MKFFFLQNVPHIKNARCISFETNRISSFENMQQYIVIEITLSQSPWILDNQLITSIRVVILALCVVALPSRTPGLKPDSV
jgi:hypothetical protein